MHTNLTGSFTSSFNDNLSGILGPVTSIVKQSNGKIVVGGYDANVVSNGYIVRLNTDGTTDSTFNINGIPFNPFDPINTIVVLPDDTLLVGLNNATRNGPSMYKLDKDGNNITFP